MSVPQSGYVRGLLDSKDMSWVPRRTCREMEQEEGGLGNADKSSSSSSSSNGGGSQEEESHEESPGGSGGGGGGGGSTEHHHHHPPEMDPSLVYQQLQLLQERVGVLTEGMAVMQASMNGRSGGGGGGGGLQGAGGH